MTTNPEEFKTFHELLTQSRPDYIPHYFRLKANDKDPDVKRSWKESRLTFDQAYQAMKQGFNIGIAGTDQDGLVIVDLDRPGIEDVKPTLRVKSRKRQGWHNFYFTTDVRCKKNIPTEESGEVRSTWQYVVVCGSFVPLEQEKIDKLPPPERQLAGCYTLENRIPPADLVFDELPAVFKMQVYEQERPPVEPEKKKVNFKSGLWKLICKDIFKDAPPQHVRWASPFHESETGKNTSMSTQGLIHCWRHNVSLTAIQALAVMSGAMSCLDAGEGHSGSGAGPSKLDLKDKELVRKIWDFAKEKGYLAEDDADPYEVESKKKKEKAEEKKYPAKAHMETESNNILYRQCIKDEVCRFARYDKTSKQITYVKEIKIGEEKIVPVACKTAVLGSFPSELKPYGTPLLLYQRLKKRFAWASAQLGHKNHIVILYLMMSGAYDPFKRKNPQLVFIGLPATGKGRFADLCRILGPYARLMTMVKEATNQRLNELFGGGLEIIDEMADDNLELEAYIRSRYDSGTRNARLLDPKSVDAIEGFRVAGPTIITRRKPFLDEANSDRAIVVECKRGDKFPLDILDRTEDEEIRDQLAMFWTEFYEDERLLPTQEELMYDSSVETIDPRLKLATILISKLAKLIGPEAVSDLEGFVEDQETLRRQLKANTAEGACIRVIWETIQENAKGHTHSVESKSGVRSTVRDTLSYDLHGTRATIYLTRTPNDGGEDHEAKMIPINFTTIANRANLKRDEPAKVLQAHGVFRDQGGPSHDRVRTISIDIPAMDRAFKNFLTEYDSAWKQVFGDLTTATKFDDFTDPPSPPNQPAPSSSSSPPSPLPDATIEKALVNEQIANLDTCVVVNSDDKLRAVEREILEWLLERIVETAASGDKIGPHILRNEAAQKYAGWDRERAIEIIDAFFAEVERVGTLIYCRKLSVQPNVQKSAS